LEERICAIGKEIPCSSTIFASKKSANPKLKQTQIPKIIINSFNLHQRQPWKSTEQLQEQENWLADKMVEEQGISLPMAQILSSKTEISRL